MEEIMGFRNDFVWGVATSAYQIEGAAGEAGKGMDIWESFCRQPGAIYEGQSGKIACDHYHRYQEDIEHIRALGCKAYRFSVNWSRILPAGTGTVNEAGLSFYDALIDSLLENKIEPYLTLYHWELPQKLQLRGGWLNPESPDWFYEYASVIAKHFSGRVTKFFTLNEPQCFVGLSALHGVHAPGIRLSLPDTFLMAHNVLKAHGMGVRALREHSVCPVEIGFAPTGPVSYPASEALKDKEAAREEFFRCPDQMENWTWNIAWWSDPVFLGTYPEDGLKKYAPYLPKITKEDMKLISEPIDFLGQNIYNGHAVRAGANGTETVARYEGFPNTATGWPVTPECIRYSPVFLYERYHKPIYITENGMACHDAISLDGNVHDPNRIDFLARYLQQLKLAVSDGADIRGYFAWSLLDNFEWNEGYSKRFGLIFVDYRTQKRIWKDSAYWYRDLIAANGENLPDILQEQV